MSDERLGELGIPRRRFLKGAAAASFVAPVVASFGLDGVAHASVVTIPNQSIGNQCEPNQYIPNQAFQRMGAILALLLYAIDVGKVSKLEGGVLSEQALFIGLELATGATRNVCQQLSQLLARAEGLPTITGPAPGTLVTNIELLMSEIGCECNGVVVIPVP